jgi:four helix bundle protein
MVKHEKFNFENLEVWQKAVEFAQRVLSLTEKINSHQKHFRIIEQLESASTSVALNIAEGHGRYSKREFMHFLYIARGSLYETITLLIILNRYNCIEEKQLLDLKILSEEIAKMLSGLISSIKKSFTLNSELRTPI